jgi:hypothetical protein
MIRQPLPPWQRFACWPVLPCDDGSRPPARTLASSCETIRGRWAPARGCTQRTRAFVARQRAIRRLNACSPRRDTRDGRRAAGHDLGLWACKGSAGRRLGSSHSFFGFRRVGVAKPDTELARREVVPLLNVDSPAAIGACAVLDGRWLGHSALLFVRFVRFNRIVLSCPDLHVCMLFRINRSNLQEDKKPLNRSLKPRFETRKTFEMSDKRL